MADDQPGCSTCCSLSCHADGECFCSHLPFLPCPALPIILAHGVSAGRRLHKERDWGDSGDPSGQTSGLVGARSFKGQRARPANRAAITPEAAETSSNAVFTGIYRPFGSTERRSYATVEPTPDVNDDRAKETVRPRARSAQDVPGLGRRTPNLGSGEEQMAVLSVGGVALAETYQGAEAVATSDSLAMNTGKTVIAASQLNSRPQVFRSTVKDTSRPARAFGVTSGNGVGSLAMSGAANGKITLAQAESAVAMSQTQTSTADQWHDGGRRLRSLAAATVAAAGSRARHFLARL